MPEPTVISSENGKVFESNEDVGDMNKVKSYKSLGHLIVMRLEEEYDKEIFIDDKSGRHWTGAQLKEAILNVACCLIDEYNFKQGTVVCLSYDHCDLSCILALGVILAGGIMASAYSMDPYSELLYLARKVEPKFLFCHEHDLAWVEKLKMDMGLQVVGITMSDMGSASVEEILTRQKVEANSLAELLSYRHGESKALSELPRACRDSERDVAFITMSSGTTGKPKAVPITHLNCLAELISLHRRRSGRGWNTRFACSASLDYVSGRLIVLGSIGAGYSIVILNGFDAPSYLRAIEKYKISVIYLGAASFYSLICYERSHPHDLSSVLMVFPMGAKVVYLDELRDFFQRHPSVRFVRQGYGTSETSGMAMNSFSPDQYLEDCENCGKLVPDSKAKIVDPDDPSRTRLLGPNQQGMLHVKGPTTFPGYYDVEQVRKINSAAGHNVIDPDYPLIGDQSVFDEDGFYITGDIAYFNDKEELYIIGRQKELMSCRGAKKVLPQELEEIIAEHPAVGKVCVLGMPNRIQLTLHCPRAFVIPRPEIYTIESVDQYRSQFLASSNFDTKKPTSDEKLVHRGDNQLCKLNQKVRCLFAEDLMEFVNERVGWEKQLTGGIVILDDIPTMRATGKMNKSYLRSLTEEQVSIYGDRSG